MISGDLGITEMKNFIKLYLETTQEYRNSWKLMIRFGKARIKGFEKITKNANTVLNISRYGLVV